MLIAGDSLRRKKKDKRQPLGILKSKSLVQQELEKDQTAKITTENIVKMWSRLWSRSRAGAEWYINQELEPLLYT